MLSCTAVFNSDRTNCTSMNAMYVCRSASAVSSQRNVILRNILYHTQPEASRPTIFSHVFTFHHNLWDAHPICNEPNCPSINTVWLSRTVFAHSLQCICFLTSTVWWTTLNGQPDSSSTMFYFWSQLLRKTSDGRKVNSTCSHTHSLHIQNLCLQFHRGALFPWINRQHSPVDNFIG